MSAAFFSLIIKDNAVINRHLYPLNEKKDSVTNSKESCNIALTEIWSSSQPQTAGDGLSGCTFLFGGWGNCRKRLAHRDGNLDNTGSLQRISQVLKSIFLPSTPKQSPCPKPSGKLRSTEVQQLAGGNMRIRTPDTFLSRMCWPSVLSRQVLLIEEYEEKECDNAPPPPPTHTQKEGKKEKKYSLAHPVCADFLCWDLT